MSSLLAVFFVACGGSNGPAPSPTPPVPPPASITLVDTTNPIGSRENLAIKETYAQQPFPDPNIGLFEEFQSASAIAIRTVKWQGAYCALSTQSRAIPSAVAVSFRISFYADREGRPTQAYAGDPRTLYDATLTPAEAQETLELEVPFNSNNQRGCGSDAPSPAAYYRYSATLPRPFEAAAGQRYWIKLFPVMPNGTSATIWGWRNGTFQNGSVFMLFQGLISGWNNDMAFSVSS